MVQRNIDSALFYLDKALTIDNSQIHCWLHKAVIFNYLNEYEGASYSVDSAINYCDKSHSVFKYLGDYLLGYRMNLESIRLFDSAMVRKTDDADLWFLYGLANYYIDSSISSFQYFDSCLKYYVGDEQQLLSYYSVLNSYDIGDYALKYCNSSLQINNDNPWAWQYKSWLMVNEEMIDSAIIFLDSAVYYNVGEYWGGDNYWKGVQLYNLGKTEDALNEFLKIASGDLDSSLVIMQLYSLSICYLDLNEKEKAYDLCDSMLILNPNDTNVVFFCDSIKSLNE